jgi:WD40 repeat protein
LWSIPKAHTTPLTALVTDPWDQILASASVDGEIKLWDLATHNLLASVTDGSFEKKTLTQASPIVMDLSLTSQHLFSTGFSGKLTVRQLFF